MNLLITGGCGFIGLNLIDFLQNHSSFNCNIIVLDNLSNGSIKNLNFTNHKLFKTRFELIVGDFADIALLNSLFNKYRKRF